MFERQERVGKRKREEEKVAGEKEVGGNTPKSVKKGVEKELEKKRNLDRGDGVVFLWPVEHYRIMLFSIFHRM